MIFLKLHFGGQNKNSKTITLNKNQHNSHYNAFIVKGQLQ